MHPSAYIYRIFESLDRWRPEDKELFMLRAIEGAYWVGSHSNTGLVETDEEIARLSRVFPMFKNQSPEMGTVRHIGDALAKANPDIVKRAKKYRDSSASFKGYPSPATYLEYKYASLAPGQTLHKPKQHILFNELKEGAIWEAKHPTLDYGLSRRDPVVLWIQHRCRLNSLKATILGVRVRTLKYHFRPN